MGLAIESYKNIYDIQAFFNSGDWKENFESIEKYRKSSHPMLGTTDPKTNTFIPSEENLNTNEEIASHIDINDIPVNFKKVERIPINPDGFAPGSATEFADKVVIPSGNITMKDMQEPILANGEMLMPGDEAQFDTDYVVEEKLPKAQDGLKVEGKKLSKKEVDDVRNFVEDDTNFVQEYPYLLDEVVVEDKLDRTNPTAVRNWSREHDPIAYAAREATDEAAPYVATGLGMAFAPAAGSLLGAGARGLAATGEAAYGALSPYASAAWNTNIPGALGMSSVPGATVGNLINAGFGTHGATNIAPDALELLTNPLSLENLANVGIDALEMAPMYGPMSKMLGELETIGRVGKSSKPTSAKVLMKEYDAATPKAKEYIVDPRNSGEGRVFKMGENRNTGGIPYNTKTGKSIQSEFIEEHNAYMNSPAFEQKMKKNYPDVDIEKYKKAINANLNRENIEGTALNPHGGPVGWYTPRENVPNGTILMSKQSFATRVRLANEEILKPAYQSKKDAGKSFTKNVGGTVEHELGHQRTNSNWLLPDYLTQEYLQAGLRPEMAKVVQAEGGKKFMEYYSKPTEFDTRLLNLKRDLQGQGIIDYTKSNDFKKEHLEELFNVRKPKNYDELTNKAGKLQKKIAENPKYKGGFDKTTEEGRLLRKQHDLEWEEFYSLNRQRNPGNPGDDARSLYKYWDIDFLVKQLKKLPAVIPFAIAGGSSAPTSGYEERPSSTINPSIEYEKRTEN